MIERNIFTKAPSRAEKAADVVLALVIAGFLLIGLLAYFDVLC